LRQDELFIGGNWSKASTDRRIEVISPHTETPVAQVASAGPDDLTRADEVARAAFDTGPWPRLQPAERIDAVRRLAKASGDSGRRQEDGECTGRPVDHVLLPRR